MASVQTFQQGLPFGAVVILHMAWVLEVAARGLGAGGRKFDSTLRHNFFTKQKYK